MLSSALIAFALSIAGTFASPIISARQPGCRPNFEGINVSVVNNVVEWGFASTPAQGSTVVNEAFTNAQAEFRFEFTGAPANTYLIKSAQAPQGPEVVIIPTAGNKLALSPENLSSPSDPNQNYILSCDTCQTGASGIHGLIASGCTITSASNNQCVTTDSAIGDALSLATCTTLATQKFDFYTV
jgi:hypothetical protein